MSWVISQTISARIVFHNETDRMLKAYWRRRVTHRSGSMWDLTWVNVCWGVRLWEEAGYMCTSGNRGCQWASRCVLKDITEDALTISAGGLFQNGTARMVKAYWRLRVQHLCWWNSRSCWRGASYGTCRSSFINIRASFCTFTNASASRERMGLDAWIAYSSLEGSHLFVTTEIQHPSSPHCIQ